MCVRKKLTKITLIMLVVVILMSSLFAFAACGEVGGKISQIHCELVDGYDEGSLVVGERYSMKFEFSVTMIANNKGNALLDVFVELPGTGEIEGFIYDIDTGNTEPMTVKEDGLITKQGVQGKYTLPDEKDEVLSVNVEISFKPIKATQIQVKLKLSGTNISFKGNANGYTKTLYANDIELQAPVISFDSNTKRLSWENVEGAVTYFIYADNEKIKEVSAQDGTNFINLGPIKQGSYAVTVVAIGSNAQRSPVSNIIDVQI